MGAINFGGEDGQDISSRTYRLLFDQALVHYIVKSKMWTVKGEHKLFFFLELCLDGLVPEIGVSVQPQ